MVEVEVTDEFKAWYAALNETEFLAVNEAVRRLEELGVQLGFPHSSAIKGWRYPIRELRFRADGRPIRIFYAFDPRRQAVLLLGVDKGSDGNAVYERMQKQVERIWEEYLAEQAKEQRK